jgi:hypothetical protein
MNNQFFVEFDPLGNLYCEPGVVIDLGGSTSQYFQFMPEIDISTTPVYVANSSFNASTRYPDEYLKRFVGGSGQSMEATGSVTGTYAPIGYFRRIGKFTWTTDFGHTIVFDQSTGNADLLDYDESSTVIATFSDPSATIAPVGPFASTSAGDDTYNGGSPFALTMTYEGIVEDFDANVVVEGTVAPVGTFSTIADGNYSYSSGSWVSDVDPDWTITLDNSGNGKITDATDDVALRDTVDAVNPIGTYFSTEYAADEYNGGQPFYLIVGIEDKKPISGYVYAKMTISSGRIVSADGIFFASSIPTNTSTEQYVPIAHCTGYKVIQIQQGPIFWK